jgi:hypothetical protein
MWIRPGYKYQHDDNMNHTDYFGRYFQLPEWWPASYMFEVDLDYVHWSRDDLLLRKAFCWNGANAYPDYEWIIIPSAIHDGMLQCLEYLRRQGVLSSRKLEQLKEYIDRWFAEEAKRRMPWYRKSWNATLLFFGVNELSKIAPGPNQAEAHRAEWYD